MNVALVDFLRIELELLPYAFGTYVVFLFAFWLGYKYRLKENQAGKDGSFGIKYAKTNKTKEATPPTKKNICGCIDFKPKKEGE